MIFFNNGVNAMKKIKKSILAIFISVAVSPAFVSAVPAETNNPPVSEEIKTYINKGGVEVQEIRTTARGNSSSAAGVIGDDGGSVEGILSMQVASCNYWWLSGNHSWSWQGLKGFYMENKISASSSTYYGGSSNPDECGRPPLIVDELILKASSHGTSIPVFINETRYNVSSISKTERSYGVGGLADPQCGADSYHEAYKSGVRWHTATWSGC